MISEIKLSEGSKVINAYHLKRIWEGFSKQVIKRDFQNMFTLPLESRPKPNAGGGTTLVYKTTAVNRQK